MAFDRWSNSFSNGKTDMASAKMLLVADFNIGMLGRFAANSDYFVGFEFVNAPYGQVYQTLSAAPADSVTSAIVWTTPEGIIPSFSKALEFERIDAEQCLTEVDQFADHLLRFGEGMQFMFVVNWALPNSHRGHGMLDWRTGLGLSNLLARMNLRLADRLSKQQSSYLFESSRWLRGDADSSQKMWYAAKVPYRNIVFEHAVRDLGAAVQAIKGRSKKLVIVDLDNTLWGNVVGENGWADIRLGGIDYVGEAFRDFQKALRALTRKGIQLAIVSKNDESVALQAIDEHPEMILRRSDFAGWRINWSDKAENLRSLVAELNLGLSSVVFIDDNPAERDRIRTAYPEVLVPEWPSDPCSYVTALRSLDCFETAGLTDEDRNRTAMYVAERERREIRSETSSIGDWLSRLQTQLRYAPVTKQQIARVAQLFNKTNQLNLSTRRMTAQEILAWTGQQNRAMLAIWVKDRFGDLGLSGIVAVEVIGKTGQLLDFILSCRAMGRSVEEAMLHVAAAQLRLMGARTMLAAYVPTERNRPTLDVLASSKLLKTGEREYVFDLADGYEAPAEIKIEPFAND
jgi:FkbH-like protein